MFPVTRQHRIGQVELKVRVAIVVKNAHYLIALQSAISLQTDLLADFDTGKKVYLFVDQHFTGLFTPALQRRCGRFSLPAR